MAEYIVIPAEDSSVEKETKSYQVAYRKVKELPTQS